MSDKKEETAATDEAAEMSSSSSSSSSSLSSPPPPFPFEALVGEKLWTKVAGRGDHEQPTAELLKDAEWVGIFFAAAWDGACKRFTPYLLDFYKQAEQKNCKFKVVYVGSDHTIQCFEEYFVALPWYAMSPTRSADLKNALALRFQVTGIPRLILLNKKGEFVTSDTLKPIFELMDEGGSKNVVSLFDEWKKIEPVPLDIATLQIKKKAEELQQSIVARTIAMIYANPVTMFVVSYLVGKIFWIIYHADTGEEGEDVSALDSIAEATAAAKLASRDYAADAEF